MPRPARRAGSCASTLVASVLLAAGQQTLYSSLFALIADVSGPGPKDRPFAIVAMVQSAAFGTGALIAGVSSSGRPSRTPLSGSSTAGGRHG